MSIATKRGFEVAFCTSGDGIQYVRDEFVPVLDEEFFFIGRAHQRNFEFSTLHNIQKCNVVTATFILIVMELCLSNIFIHYSIRLYANEWRKCPQIAPNPSKT